jgi:metal-responsive CopG/Arc/MetJ family transcriptional regulator
MTTEDSDCVEFEVSLPEDLVVELDEYRAHCGYPSRSAVVTEALRE